MDITKEERLSPNMIVDHSDERPTKRTLSILGSSVKMVRLSISSLGIVILSILVNVNLATSDPECGINRFNNESPLTERIVGGNNSLQ